MSKLKSYGYFFNGYNPNDGEYLLLPDGHGSSEREEAQKEADTDYEFCAFFYSTDGKTYSPFSGLSSENLTLVVDRSGRLVFEIDYSDYSFPTALNGINHVQYPIDSRLKEHYDFERAKRWLEQHFSAFDITLSKNEGITYFTVQVTTESFQSHAATGPDLIKTVIQLYHELKED